MSFGFSHIWIAKRSSAYAIVEITVVVVSSEAVVILTFTCVSVVFSTSIEIRLKLHVTTFFDCENMLVIFLSMKLIPKGMLTASLLTM